MSQRIVSIDNAEHYVWGGNCDGWHLLNQPGLSVIRERVPVGGAEVAHYHERAQQFFYVLSGCMTLRVNDALETLHNGQGIAIAPRVVHKVENHGPDPLEFLVISSPHSHGDRVRVED